MMLEAILQLELSKVRHLIFILTCLLPTLTCQARTIIVDDDGPADFNTIQAAIDDANHGDVIVVKPGIYSGDGNHDVYFGSKAITVRSEKGPNVTVINCENNDYGFGIRDNDVSEARLEGFTIRNATYGAIRCYSSVLPRSPVASEGSHMNVAILYNPDYADVVIANCVITANQSIGIVCDGHDNVTITNCDISRNGGQGVYSYMSRPTIRNCLVAENGKTGIRATGPTIVNCTIVANQFDGVWAREANVTNSIIWRNSGEQIRNLDGNFVVTYSNVQGGWKGRGNIDADPLFADPDSSDYHLLPRSPCIDAGDPNYVPQPNETDLDGNPRITNSVIDMGAYEWHWPHILYVDADADGANDGSSWENAYNYLQDALTDASSAEKPVEIWVGQGIYAPDSNSVEPEGTGDPNATFQLIDNVTLKGGYAGFGQPNPNARDIEVYTTVLSGDLHRNDGPQYDSQSDNSYHVTKAVTVDTTSALDGFTITCGYARERRRSYEAIDKILNASTPPPPPRPQPEQISGGGMYIDGGSPRVISCTFIHNRAKRGGGVCNRNYSSSVFTNCAFIENEADYGGAIENDGHSLVLAECALTKNSAYLGGAVYNRSGGDSLLVLNDCTLTANAADRGAGVYNGTYFASVLKLTGCRLIGNRARVGAGIYNEHSYRSSALSPQLLRCTFAGNTATAGSSLVCESSHNASPGNVRISDSILWNGSNEILNNDNSTVEITYTCIRSGWPGEGNISLDPCFVHAGFWDANETLDDADDDFWVDGDYHLKSQAGRWDPNSQSWVQDDVTSPCIDAGDPMFPMGHEPFPNGGIINMGAYGGTAEASRSYFGEPVCETIIAGDINGDCKIDFLDFAIMSYHWLEDHRGQ